MARKTVIGNLRINVTSVTTQFNRGLGKAANRVNAISRFMKLNLGEAVSFVAGRLTGLFASAISGAIRGLVRLVVTGILFVSKALATTFVVAVTSATVALGLLTRSAFQSVDAIVQSAKKLGIAVRDFAVLELAGKEARIEFQTLQIAVQRMTRRVSEASQGFGEARDTLKELNLEAKVLTRLAPDKQFAKILEAVEKIPNQNERIQKLFKLFDSEGVVVAKLLGTSFEETAERARLMGLALDDVKFQAISDANDAVLRFKETMRGLGRVVAGEVAPIVEGFFTFIVDKIIDAGGVTEVLRKAIDKIGPTLANALELIEKVTSAGLLGIASAFRVVVAVIDSTKETVAGFVSFTSSALVNAAVDISIAWTQAKIKILDTIAAMAAPIGKLTKLFTDASLLFLKTRLALAELARVPNKIILKVKLDIAALELAQEDFDEFIKTTREGARVAGEQLAVDLWGQLGNALAIQSEDVGGKLRSLLDKSFDALQDVAGRIADMSQRVGERIKAGIADDELVTNFIALLQKWREEYTKLGIAAKEAADNAAKSNKKLEDTIKKIETVTGDAASGMIDNLKQTEDAFDALKLTALQVLDDIITAFAKAKLLKGFGAILGPLFENLGVPGVFGGEDAASRAAAAPAPAQSLFDETERGQTLVFNFNEPVVGEDAIEQRILEVFRREEAGTIQKSTAQVQRNIARSPAWLGGI